MKRTVRALMALVGLGLVLCAVILAVGWWAGPFDEVVLSLNDDVFTLADVHGSRHAVSTTLAISGLVFLMLIALPVAVLLPLLAVGMAMAVAALTLAGVAAFFLWPFFLLGWWLLRRSRRRPGAATIAR